MKTTSKGETPSLALRSFSLSKRRRIFVPETGHEARGLSWDGRLLRIEYGNQRHGITTSEEKNLGRNFGARL